MPNNELNEVSEEIILESSTPSNNKSSCKKSLDGKLTPKKNESLEKSVDIVDKEIIDNKNIDINNKPPSVSKDIMSMLKQSVNTQGMYECITIKDNEQYDTVVNRISPDKEKLSYKFNSIKDKEKIVLGTTRPKFIIENQPKIVLGNRQKMEIDSKQRISIDVNKKKISSANENYNKNSKDAERA